MFVPVHVPQPSRRARDLGEKMAELIRIYKSEDPKLSLMEIRQAMRVAENSVMSEFPGLAGVRMAVILVAAGLVAGLVAFLFFAKSGGGAPAPMFIMIAVAVMLIGVLAVVLSRNLRS